RPWYSLGSPKKGIEYNHARGSIDSRKDSVRKDDASSCAEVDEFPYRLSPGLRNRSHWRVNSTESIQIPCTHSASSSIARHRYSCDGRDLSRPPPAVDHMDAYRSSSLRALEFPRLYESVDSPGRTRRSSNLIAKLMGLDDMPEPLLPPATPARKATEVEKDVEDVKREVAAEKGLEALRLKESLRTPANSSDTELLVATTKPRSFFSPTSAPFNPNTPLQKNLPMEDQKPSNILSNCVTETLNFGDNVSARRSKPKASKLPKEKSDTTSPRKPATTRYKTEILPKSPPKIEAKEQRKRKEMQKRLDKTNIKKDRDSRGNSALKSDGQTAKTNRSLDLRPKSRRVTTNFTNETCKAEHKKTAKPCEKEVIPAWRTENSREVPEEPSPVSVLDQSFCSEDNSPSPAIEVALNFVGNLPESLERTDNRNSDESLNKEISKPEEPVDFIQNIKSPKAEDHMAGREPNLMDSTQSISQKYFLSCSRSQSKDRKVEEYVTRLFRACDLLKYGDEERDVSMH
ncbi:hypothetical protein KI387_012536, partial [Taxus chinensis]